MKPTQLEFERGEPRDVTEIVGWGVDADPRNDPTYPMKKRTNAEHKGYVWERPVQQSSKIEVLQSNERPNLTAVYGTSVPPTGLSGALRRVAFRFSESSYGHWIPLLLADRVNMLEGVADDLQRGRVPNILAEMGWRADWEHDRPRVIARCAVGLILTVGIVAALRGRSHRRRVRRQPIRHKRLRRRGT